jgi:hypothetical protein
MGDFQEIRDVVADAFVHLLPEIDVVRLKRVFEIEDPGLDVLEAPRAPVARGFMPQRFDPPRSREAADRKAR